MTIDRILSLIAIIVSFIAVPASGYLSYRYAIIGEKRKEFNAIADVIRQKLREQSRLIDNGIIPGGKVVDISQREFDNFIDVCKPSDRDTLNELWDSYAKVYDECVERGNPLQDPALNNPHLLKGVIDKIQMHTNRR